MDKKQNTMLQRFAMRYLMNDLGQHEDCIIEKFMVDDLGISGRKEQFDAMTDAHFALQAELEN